MEVWKKTTYVCVLGAFLTSLGISQIAPILPLYLAELGVNNQAELTRWSGLAMGATYLVVALAAPFWGRLADRKGRKLILLRASLGMLIINILISYVTTPAQLVACRLIQGLVSGFYSGSITLVASEAPKAHVGWALGILSSANLAGSLIGPLIGGYIAGVAGFRNAFLIIAFFLGIAFLLTIFFVHENYRPGPEKTNLTLNNLKSNLPHLNGLLIIAASGFMYAIAFMSLQPIITIYVKQILPENVEHVAFLAGLIFSITGFAQMIASSFIGNLIDSIGSRKVLTASLIFVAIMTIPQAFVTNIYQLALLRALLGIGLAGLLPGINTYISTHTPQHLSAQVFSYNQTFQFLGYFMGSVGGAYMVSWMGFDVMFCLTGLLFILNAVWVWTKIQK